VYEEYRRWSEALVGGFAGNYDADQRRLMGWSSRIKSLALLLDDSGGWCWGDVGRNSECELCGFVPARAEV